MPDPINLAAAVRGAVPLGERRCATCKHFVRPQDFPPGYGQCREHLVVVNSPTTPGNLAADVLDKPVGNLTVREMLNLLLPREPMPTYANIRESTPACGRYAQRLEGT